VANVDEQVEEYEYSVNMVSELLNYAEEVQEFEDAGVWCGGVLQEVEDLDVDAHASMEDCVFMLEPEKALEQDELVSKPVLETTITETANTPTVEIFAMDANVDDVPVEEAVEDEAA
jgi:hypothetical protein